MKKANTTTIAGKHKTNYQIISIHVNIHTRIYYIILYYSERVRGRISKVKIYNYTIIYLVMIYILYDTL